MAPPQQWPPGGEVGHILQFGLLTIVHGALWDYKGSLQKKTG